MLISTLTGLAKLVSNIIIPGGSILVNIVEIVKSAIELAKNAITVIKFAVEKWKKFFGKEEEEEDVTTKTWYLIQIKRAAAIVASKHTSSTKTFEEWTAEMKTYMDAKVKSIQASSEWKQLKDKITELTSDKFSKLAENFGEVSEALEKKFEPI